MEPVGCFLLNNIESYVFYISIPSMCVYLCLVCISHCMCVLQIARV